MYRIVRGIDACEFFVVFDTKDKNYFDGDPYIRGNTLSQATRYKTYGEAKKDKDLYDGIGKENLVIQKITIQNIC